jgi:hypothetical protein
MLRSPCSLGKAHKVDFIIKVRAHLSHVIHFGALEDYIAAKARDDATVAAFTAQPVE